MRRFVTFAIAALTTFCAEAQQPRYEEMIALRSSFGFRAALEAADARLAVDATDATAAGVRALVYANGSDFLGMAPAESHQGKEAALARALQLAPTNPWTRAAYGLIHQVDDVVGAERELSRCIAEFPSFLECYNLYGDLLRKTKRQEEAAVIYLRGLKRWPTDGELLVSFALHLQETNRVEQAIKVLKDLTRDQPQFARGHWHLASLLYESGGDRARAMVEAQRALELDPLIWNGQKLLELLGAGPNT